MVTIKDMKTREQSIPINRLKTKSIYSLRGAASSNKGTVHSCNELIGIDYTDNSISINTFRMNVLEKIYPIWYYKINCAADTLKNYYYRNGNGSPWWIKLQHLKIPLTLEKYKGFPYASIQLYCNGILFNDWDPDQYTE